MLTHYNNGVPATAGEVWHMVEGAEDRPWHGRANLRAKTFVCRHPKSSISCISPCKDLIVCKRKKTGNHISKTYFHNELLTVLLPSVAAIVKPSPQDTLFTIFPPKGPTRTWTPWCFLKSFTPSCPNLLQPNVIRRPRAAKPAINILNHLFSKPRQSSFPSKVTDYFYSTINCSCVSLPWWNDGNLEAGQLLYQSESGNVWDPLITLSHSKKVSEHYLKNNWNL